MSSTREPRPQEMTSQTTTVKINKAISMEVFKRLSGTQPLPPLPPALVNQHRLQQQQQLQQQIQQQQQQKKKR